MDGGDATLDDEVIPPPPVTNSNDNIGTGNNPNAGAAGGQGADYVIPGDGSWAVDGGNAIPGDQVIPPEPAA